MCFSTIFLFFINNVQTYPINYQFCATFLRMAKKKKTPKKSKKKSNHFLSWLFVIALLSGLGYWGYSYLKSPVYQANKAIPNDAFLVFETHNPKSFWDALNYDNALWSGLQSSSSIAHFNRNIRRLDSLLMMDDDFWDITEDNYFYGSLHAEKDGIQSLWIIGLDDAHQENNVQRFVQNFFTGSASITKNSFHDFSCFTVVNGDTKFYYSVPYGIFIASESLSLIEKSLQQLEEGTGLITQNDFKEIKETCGKKVDANIYIANKKLDFLTKKFSLHAPFAVLQNLENLSLWNGLDMYVKSDSWSWNGYTSIADADLLVLFQAQQPVENKGVYLLPKETVAWMQLGFSEPAHFFDYLSKYQSKSNILNAIDKKFNVSLLNDFKSFAGNELYYAWLQNAPVLLLHLSDIEKATSTMMKLSDPKADYRAGDIMPLNSVEFCNAIFGTNIFQIRPSHWCVFGEYLVLGESSSIISTLVNSQNNITENAQYQSMTENIVDHSNFMFYCDLSNADGFMRNNCTQKLYNQYKKNKALISDFNGCCIQFSASSGLFYTNSIISYKSNISDVVPIEEHQVVTSDETPTADTAETSGSDDFFETVSDVLFTNGEEENAKTAESEVEKSASDEASKKTDLKGKMILKPYPIYDHSAKDKKFVIFDNQSNMYLIDQKGQIIWTKILHDNPISDVYQVDYYANGKIQYLFNSKNYLYMIDLKGNWVSGYPKKLNDGAQNPIAVFDYNKKKDYRIVFVDNKGVIHNYSKEGKTVSGWENPSLAYKISTPAELCMTDNSKWLIFQMDNGKVLITYPTGKTWIKIDKSFTNSIRSDFYLNRTNSKGIMLTTDTKGTLIYIPEKGEVKTTSFGTFSNKHYFLYNDFNGDGSNDFIYLDGKKLTVFDRLQNVLLTYSFPSEPAVKPDVYYVDKQCYLSVFVASEEKVYIFNKKGLLTTITATTPADIIKNNTTGKLMITVGNGKQFEFCE